MKEVRIARNCGTKIREYDKPKYQFDAQIVSTRVYKTASTLEIVTGNDSAELESELKGKDMDVFHEYVILHLKEGARKVFRSSYVDVVRC